MTVKPAIPHFCIADARLLLLCIAILCSRFTWGQSIRVLSTKDGLPQSFVSGLVQDKEGFIWIGTRNGLARYDGIQYKIFRHNVNDSTSIASNVIIWMNMDRRNHLWIEYETGDIDELDPVTEKINHFISVNLKHTPQVRFVRRGWLVDSTGVFWGIIKGAGLNSYDKKTKKIDRYRAPAEFPGDTLRGIAEDGSGKIWVLSQRAISFLDKPHHKFVHTTIPFDQDYNNYFDSDEEVVDLHQRPDGGLMWGDRRRLYFFDPSTSGFKTVALTHFPDAGIRWIRSGPDSSEYFESGGNVFRYDDFNGLSKVGTVGISNPGDTRSFLADRSGLLWVGTNAAGIHQLDIITPFFKSYAYEKGYPLSLLRQEFGLSMNEMFDWTKEDELFSAPGYHFRSCYDRNRRLWMGLKQTVCYYNFLNQQSVKLPAVPIGRESPQNGIGIKGLTVTARGIPVVIGFNGSIYVYDSLARDWNAFIEPSVLRKTFGTGLLPQDLVADEDRLWITTAQDGLLHINLRTKEIKQLKSDDRAGSLPTNQLLGILEDPSRPGLLWIGSYQGLISVDKKTLLCKLYSLEEGLPDNTVYSIQADGAGDLWISTNKGLCRFNPLTQKTRSFRAAYGLPGDEFNRFHHLKLPDGRLSFGGTEGWTLFDPMTIKNDEFEPVVSLTSLRVNNVLINPAASGSLLKVPVNSLGSLTLSFSDNTIAIGFAGLQFNQPQDLLYRYRLKGYDDDWIETGHSPVASYTKIPPGHYTLLVNASNSNGKWSSYIKTIDILIRPPWWRAWWAWVCYAIALSGLAWAFISFRVKRGLIKQEMQLKERESRQLKELDSMKTRFFANITHEFRTPLTLILGPAGQLKNRYADDVQQKKLTDTITRNANQLLGLINQLMDLAKLEAKAMAPAESIGKPADTIKSVLNSFESEAQSKNILLSFDNSSVEQDYRFAADVLERIVYNLVSNALKFTPEKGTIMVRLATLAGDEGVALTVEDNGSGIAPDSLPHIFDRFYQAHTDTGHEAGKRAGTGIGLSLVKELVELQGGTIQVQSRFRFATEQNPGTIFTITLPYKVADDENEENEPASDLAVALENPGTDDDMRPRVLLAEDSDELADFISDSLAGDYAVSHFSNGALALDNALRLMPDIIISDVLMPVMDGFALTAHIRKDIRTSHIPVILLTAKASHESRIEGLTAGANDYLTKPFHPEELLLRIRNLLEQQTRLQEHARQQLLPAWPKAHGAVTQQEDPFLVKLYGLIEERLDDPLFGVEELVQKMDMSRTSLHRKIKSIAGMSTGDVIRNYRLKRAAVFLLEGNSSTDAAYMSGFGSPAYFTKCFREVNGITPGEFIRQNQQVS